MRGELGVGGVPGNLETSIDKLLHCSIKLLLLFRSALHPAVSLGRTASPTCTYLQHLLARTCKSCHLYTCQLRCSVLP